jgi:hypothetical protein
MPPNFNLLLVYINVWLTLRLLNNHKLLTRSPPCGCLINTERNIFVSFFDFFNPRAVGVDQTQWYIYIYTHTHTHTHTHTARTLGRNPLDERSACRRDLYLTKHNIYRDRQPCPQRDSNPYFH